VIRVYFAQELGYRPFFNKSCDNLPDKDVDDIAPMADSRNGVGQAAVFTPDELDRVFEAIATHSHSERNLVIVLFSFCLGFRAQEIALLENQFVVSIHPGHSGGFKIPDTMNLPARITKGASPLHKRGYGPRDVQAPRRTVGFRSVKEFDKTVRQIAADAIDGKPIVPSAYYPERKAKGGKTRELELIDPLLRAAIHNYTLLKITSQNNIGPNDPFIVSQKGCGYSPNSMQQLMGKIYRKWALIPRASSHSGRRTMATKLLKRENIPLKHVQEILGHASAATTIIYQEEATKEEKRRALNLARVNKHGE